MHVGAMVGDGQPGGLRAAQPLEKLSEAVCAQIAESRDLSICAHTRLLKPVKLSEAQRDCGIGSHMGLICHILLLICTGAPRAG